jgi:hypothetical protein
MSRTALKYDAQVEEGGRVELRLPLPSGARVTVFVVAESEGTDVELMEAAESSLDFWDNRFDDEDWNDA